MSTTVNIRPDEFMSKTMPQSSFSIDTTPFESLDSITLRAIGKLQEQHIYPDNISVERLSIRSTISYSEFKESPTAILRRIYAAYPQIQATDLMKYFGQMFRNFLDNGSNMPETDHLLVYIAVARQWLNGSFRSSMMLQPRRVNDKDIDDMIYEDRKLHPKTIQKTFARDHNVTLSDLIQLAKEHGFTLPKHTDLLQLNQFVATSEGQFVEFFSNQRNHETWESYFTGKNFTVSDYYVFLNKVCDAIEHEVFGTDQAKSREHYNIYNAIRLLCSKLRTASDIANEMVKNNG